MIRELVVKNFTDTTAYKEIYCVSTDTLPTEGLVTGSMALEVDTGKLYLFNEVTPAWVLIRTIKES